MPNSKTPGNDRLSKGFYDTFWNELKDPLLKPFCHAITYKRVKMAVCGIKSIDLTIETIKILGVHFPYNQKLQTQKKFVKSITNM